MRFRMYPKISGAAKPVGGDWIATEKVHGANFVVGFDRAHDTIEFGKRKAWLAPDDAFFGWQLVARELEASVRALAALVDAPQLVCYGELCGGRYDHGDVPAIPGLAPVQNGIYYAPDLRWIAFDLLVATGDPDDGELLAYTEAEALAAEAGIVTPPFLARIKIGEIDRIPIEEPTRVPALFGLPALTGNTREGFVLKPDRRMPYAERPILKRRIPAHRFDELDAWDPGHLSVDELLGWLPRLVTDARIASARSKVGTDASQILDEVVLDVAADLETVFRDSWRALDRDAESRVLDAVRVTAERIASRQT